MADKRKGFILLYRSIRDHWLWKVKPFDPARAWIDLVLDANHDEGKVFTGANLVKIGRGQDWVSVRALADRWGWSRDRVSKYLDMLESDSMIQKKPTPSGTLLTIVNYDIYQIRQDTKTDTKKTQTRTETGRRPGRNKEEQKEEPKELEKSASAPVLEDDEDDDAVHGTPDELLRIWREKNGAV